MKPTEEAINYAAKKIEEKDKRIDRLDYYKKQNQTVLILSFAGIIFAAILGILFTPIGGRINLFVLLIIGGLFSFSASYIVLSIILEILSIFFKNLKQEGTKFTIKIVVCSVTVIVIVILLFISSFSMFDGRNFNPTDYTRSLLKTQINNPGAESCTDPVTFTRSKSTISAEGITRDTGMSPEQVIFSNPLEIVNFDIPNSSQLKYMGWQNKRVMICIICSQNGKTGLQQALIANNVNSNINLTIEEETICIVYPRRTT